MNRPDPDPPDPAAARFVGHLLGVSEQALVFLGHAPNPVNGQPERSLPMAREMIDHLEMLETKTRGNLSKEESQILRDVLTRLRLAYAEECSRPGETAGPEEPAASTPRHDAPPSAEPAAQDPGAAPGAAPKISGDSDSRRRRFHKTYE